MYCINLESHDPFFNLAVEENLLKNRKEDFLMLGINDSSIIIGKHQIAHREADTKFVAENNIPVIRRISGGGTVFHDMGNLNFSFILQSEHGKQVDFRRYTLPVISFLSSLGVDAKLEGKNDLKVSVYKISGNAEHVYRNRVLHHGTVLFDANLDLLKKSIRKDKNRYITRAVGSNPSSVMNLKDTLNNIKDIYEFRSLMMNWVLKNFPDAELYSLTPEEMEEAESLAESKYRTWEWNYAYGPEYQFFNSFELNGRQHTCRLSVKDGIIRKCEINGSDEMVAAWQKLIGCRHMVSELLEVLQKGNFSIQYNEIFNFF
jgi:lipoate-protein ligase A